MDPSPQGDRQAAERKWSTRFEPPPDAHCAPVGQVLLAMLSPWFLCPTRSAAVLTVGRPAVSCCPRAEQPFPDLKGSTQMISQLTRSVVNFLQREDGPTAVEYAVMLALIIVVCIVAITALGSNANATFSSVSNTIGSTTGS